MCLLSTKTRDTSHIFNEQTNKYSLPQRQRGIFRATLLILKIPHRPFPKWGNELPRSPEDFRDEVSTIENVCNSLSFRTCWSDSQRRLASRCGIQIILLCSWMPRSLQKNGGQASRSMTEYMIYFYPEAELRRIL